MSMTGPLSVGFSLRLPAWLNPFLADWGAALADPSPQGFGRRYVSYWETRNLRMVARSLPILRDGGAFVAVGALHLPGDTGFVSLLRDKGYTVTPAL